MFAHVWRMARAEGYKAFEAGQLARQAAEQARHADAVAAAIEFSRRRENLP
jgi:hypothetical protein